MLLQNIIVVSARDKKVSAEENLHNMTELYNKSNEDAECDQTNDVHKA